MAHKLITIIDSLFNHRHGDYRYYLATVATVSPHHTQLAQSKTDTEYQHSERAFLCGSHGAVARRMEGCIVIISGSVKTSKKVRLSRKGKVTQCF